MNQAKRDANRLKYIVSTLLPWFTTNARDLPWRREPYCKDPYCVFVSEIMLQQTQVNTVIGYWERWMRALPDVGGLARARAERVLKLWEGLGYYRRARHLHGAAREIMERHGGRFPEEYEAVLALPGVGRYTAGAICSIAFNQPRAILDGNVMRVLARVFAVRGDPRTGRTNARLWELAGELVRAAAALGPVMQGPRGGRVRRGNCGLLNEGLMELGAVICAPRAPRCEVCPLSGFCAARQTGRVSEFPELPRRRPSTAVRMAAFAIEHRGRVLVRQRPAGVVNAHFWELPNGEWPPGASLEEALGRAMGMQIRNPKSEIRTKPEIRSPKRAGVLLKLGTVKHSITRYRIGLEAYYLRLDGVPGRAGKGGRWVTAAQLQRLAVVSAHRRVLGLLEKWQNNTCAMQGTKRAQKNGTRQA